MTTTNKTQAKVFEFINDEIRAGSGDLVLPGSDGLSGVIKRYKEGGENKMHCHPAEDHTFYVLEGQGTFRIESDDNMVVVNRNEGVFLPKGTNYWFTSTGDTSLIILRVGTETGSDRIIDGQLVKSHRTGATAKYIPAKELPF
jgi:mannose-6-phosphate isomerase-like protein (cupin superfamily)